MLVDAPGLDADVQLADDDQAMQAIWLLADVRIFVHAVREGELDASEMSLLSALQRDRQRSSRQTLLVATQIDQLADDGQLDEVTRLIASQAPSFQAHLASASRHRYGLDSGKELLLERSGIPSLRAHVRAALDQVPQARSRERAALIGEICEELAHLLDSREIALGNLLARQARELGEFDSELLAVLNNAYIDIQRTLAAPGPDHSLTPDSFANQFKVAPGKLERNRLQVAYSKACIQINSVLLRHGAAELPIAQQTAVRSLDNVMVAVMGVNVKFRKDLAKIFCEPTGRERLHREVSRYFELSQDRGWLAATVGDAQGEVTAAREAMASIEG